MTSRLSLFLGLLLFMLLPSLYQLSAAHLISAGGAQSLSVAAQIEWFDLISETLKMFLLVPLYFLFNRDKNMLLEHGMTITGIVSAVYLLFSVAVHFMLPHFVREMAVAPDILVSSLNYLRLENIGFVFEFVFSAIVILLLCLGKNRIFCLLAVLKTLLLFAAYHSAVPRYGVTGLAGSNIAAHIVMIAVSLLFLKHYGFRFKMVFRKENMHTMAKVGFFSGASNLLNNIVYAVMIVKMVNLVAEQGTYWLLNNFIWGLLLIPVFALSELQKRENQIGIKPFVPYLLSVFAVWLLSLPAWPWLMQHLFRMENAETVYMLGLLALPFYVAFACSQLIDSFFISKGKTHLIFINDVLVNSVYYGIWFVLVKNGLVKLDLRMIVLMFGGGMVVHLAISAVQYYYSQTKARIPVR